MINLKKIRVVLAGGTGFLGKVLCQYLDPRKYDIAVLSRSHNEDKDNISFRKWDGRTLGSWVDALDCADVLINLSGKSVNCRYHKKNKQAIYNSRLESTHILGAALGKCKNPPGLWINASTATIYRDEYQGPNTERNGQIGTGFSVDVATKWEKEFLAADCRMTKKIAIRTGIVIGNEGGAFIPFTWLAALALAGRQGHGKQMMTWIHSEDFARAIEYLIKDPNTHPVVSDVPAIINICAPHPVDNKTFMHKLKRSRGHLIGLPAPKWLLEIGMWVFRTESELLLKSRWVLPEELLEMGFEFKYPTIDQALFELSSSVWAAKYLPGFWQWWSRLINPGIRNEFKVKIIRT